MTSQHHLQAQQEGLVSKNSAHRLNKVLVLLNATPLPREPVQNKGPPGPHQPAEVRGCKFAQEFPTKQVFLEPTMGGVGQSPQSSTHCVKETTYDLHKVGQKGT